MKKIIFLVITLLVLSFNITFSSNAAFANAAGEALSFSEGEYEYDSGLTNGEFLEYFVTNFPNRRGEVKEKAAAEYIARIFQLYEGEYGVSKFEPYNKDKTELDERYLQNFSFKYGRETHESNNVIITKKADKETKKTVIIGAHYDNVYNKPQDVNDSDYNFQGAYDNGTGVTVMLDLLKRLSEKDFDFNITFIAFGAEEYGMKGSSHYVSVMNHAPEDILLMVNLDVIGAGDYLYLFCDDVSTLHQEFLFDIADKNDISLKAAPFDKNVSSGQILDTMYYHIGLMSDNLPFLQKGVNCAFFFTYNWEHGLSESTENISIIHTEDDNFNTLKEKYEGYSTYMTKVSNIVYYSLAAPNFESKMIESFETKFDYSIFLDKIFLLCVGLSVLLAICGFVYYQYYKLKKERIIEIEVAPIFEKISVFGDDFEDKNKNH